MRYAKALMEYAKSTDVYKRQHVETPGLGSKAADWFKKGNKGDITGMNQMCIRDRRWMWLPGL